MRWRSKKRKKGWALDPGEDAPIGGLRERLGTNDKVWLAALLVVILVATMVITRASKTSQHPLKRSPGVELAGSAHDEAHTQFLVEFRRLAARRGATVNASFESSRVLKLVMPGDVDNDELRFLSRAAALGIQRRVRLNPVIRAYTEDTKTGNPKLVAETKWDTNSGDYIVEMK